MINGPFCESNIAARTCTPAVASNRISVDTLEDLWSQQFKYDFPEGDQEQWGMSLEDLQFLKSVTLITKTADKHYSIGLPLKNANGSMPNNRDLAEQGALHLQKKLHKNKLLYDYSKFIADMLIMGSATKVPTEDLA